MAEYYVACGVAVHAGPFGARREASAALRRLVRQTERAVYEGGTSRAWGRECEVVSASKLEARIAALEARP